MTDNADDLFMWLERNPDNNTLSENERIDSQHGLFLEHERLLLLQAMHGEDSKARAARFNIVKLVSAWRRGHSLPRSEVPALMQLFEHFGPPTPASRKTSTALLSKAAILLKANGYRVTKPRRRPRIRRRVGPTFCATFGDGEVTRMSTFTLLTNLDVGRGMRLSEAAYCSRKRTETVPPITKAHFEQDGKVLAHYSPDALGAPPTSRGAAP